MTTPGPLRQPIPVGRSILWAPASGGSKRPGNITFPVFLSQAALTAVLEHVATPPRAAVLRAARARVAAARWEETLVRDVEELPRVQPGHAERRTCAIGRHRGHASGGGQAAGGAEVHSSSAAPAGRPRPPRPPRPPPPAPPRPAPAPPRDPRPRPRPPARSAPAQPRAPAT